ncbi:MAG: ribosome biogenesis/translation initiation ATPase RLI [Desulfurococcus sp.]|nr:ribosome biogenesis/translation initiation ATPase RLI [Desulfurococcus sp.]
MVRVAIVDRSYCKPDKCSLECIRFCPVNRGRKKKAIELSSDGKYVVVYEETCIGCGICVKKCPFNALSIVNLPDELEKTLVHRYGANMFKLYNLPAPRIGGILGVIGRNGAGKSTSVKILSGQVKPNLGRYMDPPDWDEIIRYFRGTELQSYFTKLANGDIKAVVKPQYIEAAKRLLKSTVRELLSKVDERGLGRELVEKLGLTNLLDRKVSELSGGELQKFLVAATLSRNGNAFFFDEPCSYLDIRERIRVANTIREFSEPSKNYVVVVEHDLMILDYISDNIVVVYGEPGVYGIVSKPYGTRVGVNHYLKGYLPAENMRIREDEIKFRIQAQEKQVTPESYPILKWDSMVFQYGSSGFKLVVEPGDVHAGEVLGILGPNGIGKTTLIKLLSGELEPQEGMVLISAGKVSLKPQELSPRIFSEESVAGNLKSASPQTLDPSSWIYHELVRRLGLNKLLDRRVDELSGGELQKLAVAVSLAREADLYFLDEPSAYLDVEERISIARTIRRIVEEKGKSALVVEHDLLMQSYIADRVIVFLGEPGLHGHAYQPVNVKEGLNLLLKELDVTVRRDSESGRPRINKPGSVMDREQRLRGEYFLPA